MSKPEVRTAFHTDSADELNKDTILADGLAQKAFRNASWVAMQFAIFRYLLSNQTGRLDGAEKAQRHRELCDFYTGVLTGEDPALSMVRREVIHDQIHRRTQKALTDHLNEAIGFDPDGRGDLQKTARDFFEIFHRVALGVAADYPEACKCKAMR